MVHRALYHASDAASAAGCNSLVRTALPTTRASSQWPIQHHCQTTWLCGLRGKREILQRHLSKNIADRLAAAQMLSWCIVPRIAHRMRLLPPPATAAFAKAFDDSCVSATQPSQRPTKRCPACLRS